jgi:uncharacterized membrane-anchored protein YhcB (DUF1043 family)
MNTDPLVLAIVAVLFVGGGILLGLAIGRGSPRLAKRCQELETELAQSQAELATYRQQVGQHFNATGELLRAMTAQYRTVYEHLAEGARTLCPDHAASLSAGPNEPLLGDGRAPTDAAAPVEPAPAAPRLAEDALSVGDDDLEELETDEDPLPRRPTTAH